MAADALEKVDPRQLGQNLRHARVQRGLRQEDAANTIGVARTTITAIEQGQRRIKIDELIKLAEAYGRSVSDFVRPRPPARNFRVQFRGPGRAGNLEASRMVISQNEFQELCRDYLELEAIMAAPLVRRYPPEYQVEGLSADRAAEGIATQERNQLSIMRAVISGSNLLIFLPSIS